MSIRNLSFENGDICHVYNRGVDKRTIFEETEDLNRFFQSMEEFNVLKPIGSIYSNTFKKKQSLLRGKAPK